MKKLQIIYIVGLVFCLITNPVFSQDTDNDGVLDIEDNCLLIPNGPNEGSCTSGTIGELCMNDNECGANGFCSNNQEDIFPPDGNDCGDACECEGNFDGDTDVDGTDASAFKTHFGRSSFKNPCSNGDPCDGDFECDTDVDGADASNFKSDFGRSGFKNPCPLCDTVPWCNYTTTVEIDVENFRFDADSNDSTQIDTVTINVGDTVLWTWQQGTHTITSGVDLGDPNAGLLFDEPSDINNQNFAVTFIQAGTFPYFCRFHVTFQDMKGIVEVQ